MIGITSTPDWIVWSACLPPSPVILSSEADVLLVARHSAVHDGPGDHRTLGQAPRPASSAFGSLSNSSFTKVQRFLEPFGRPLGLPDCPGLNCVRTEPFGCGVIRRHDQNPLNRG
jgi:hypothetical protein